MPAQPDKQMKRQLLALQKLPDLLRRYNRFEKFSKPRIMTPEELAESKAKAEAAKAAKAAKAAEAAQLAAEKNA